MNSECLEAKVAGPEGPSSSAMTGYKECSLVLLTRDPDEVLLGLKKRGFGEGNWNGFGGKLDPSDAPGAEIKSRMLACARRETLEESGVDTGPDGLSQAGHLFFTFDSDPSLKLNVHVFTGRCPVGQEPVETEEMLPRWTPIKSIDFDAMWPDDRYWLPELLAGKMFRGRFHFADHQTIIRYRLQLEADAGVLSTPLEFDGGRD